VIGDFNMKGNFLKNNKKIMTIALATALITSSIGVTAFATQGNDAVKKDVLMSEVWGKNDPKPPVKNTESEINAQRPEIAMNEAEAIEIGKKALKEILDLDVDELKLEVRDAAAYEGGDPAANESASKYGAVWNIYWTSANITNEKSEIPSHAASVLISSKTKEIISVSSQSYAPNQEPVNLEAEEAKELVVEFMKSNKEHLGEVKDIELSIIEKKKAFIFNMTMENGKESSVMVSPITGKIIGWSIHWQDLK
jgi:20S proteasome alpha/beta subunit